MKVDAFFDNYFVWVQKIGLSSQIFAFIAFLIFELILATIIYLLES